MSALGAGRIPCIPLILVVLIGLAGFAGCGGGRGGAGAAGGSSLVLRGADMSGSVLDGLRGRVPNMTVAPPSPGGCPEITFRGARSVANQGSPGVYVDGTLMRDTCILAQIPSADVDSVEIYPSGLTSRAGVQRNPFGLILIFRLRG